ncbi:hypothetical protein JQS43_00505 [Natronosporangium hydrolyticum]|uniref:TcpE family protein n=1 Tax=Natronosporangium hydrolyticum TaxID=2811111 RepID=A0A895YFM8_9ACTN|nr:hypothetical protein [Natronosporangium hydrolyticum]QSB14912.1 hypothetical protein JQS43_00505 [Natronosporangium hydrolyticum]
MEDGAPVSVGRTYTKGRRQPYLIRKWPGSNWALPLGPYTITQLVVFVGSVYLLITYRDLWAHFGPMNLLIGIGLPLLLTYATRHTRIEGRDPLRAGVALVGLLVQPRDGYLGEDSFRSPGATRQRGGRFPVAQLPAELVPAAPPPTQPPPAARPWLSDLVSNAAVRQPAGGSEGGEART